MMMPHSDRLKSAYCEVDQVLRSMPENSLEARRMITRDLRFEPRPEELQTIVKIAGVESDEPAVLELPRQMLALRVLAGRSLAEFWGPRELDPEKLRTSAGVLSELLGLAQQVDEAFDNLLDVEQSIGPDDRDFLHGVRQVLSPKIEEVQAAVALAPILQRLGQADSVEEVRSIAPALTAEEARMFAGNNIGSIAGPSSPSRECLDALALRSLIQSDLAEWSSLSPESENVRQVQACIIMIERLKMDRIAYHVVSDRLQKLHDEALLMRLQEFAEEMSAIKRQLFSAYVKLAPIVRNSNPLEAKLESGAGSCSIEEMLSEAAVHEAAAAKTAAENQNTEEVCREALDEMSPGQRKRKAPMRGLGIGQRQSEQRRLYGLLGVATLILTAVITVHKMVPKPPAPIQVGTMEFASAMILSEIKPVGSMMYAKVSFWTQVKTEERLGKVEHLGELAAEKGFTAVYVVDEEGEPVARWSKERGSTVIDR